MTTIGRETYHAQGSFYKDGSTYFGHNITDGTLTSGATASSVLSTLIDNLYTAYGMADVYLGAHSFDFESTSLNLLAKSNIRLRGAGMDLTTILNGAITNTGGVFTNNIQLIDFTIDANSNRGNCVNLQKVTDMRLTNMKLMDSSSSFVFNWTNSDRLIADKCIFLDGGLTVGADNCAGSQTKTTENETIFHNCHFRKTNSLGGGMLTTGGTGKLLVDGCTFYDASGNSYAAVSVETTLGSATDVRVVNCQTFGENQGIALGNSASIALNKGVIANCISTGGQQINNANEAIISNGIVTNSVYGFVMASNTIAKCNNCIAKNTNKNNATGSSDDDKGGLYGLDNDYLEINNFTALEDSGNGFMPHGIRCGSSSLTDNEVHINNPMLIGPFRDWALRISNSLLGKVTGGRLYSGATTSFSGNTTLEVRDLKHYNPVGLSAITVGASPYTYTAGTSPETIYVYGGTVSSITKAGTQIANQTGLSVEMEANTAIIVTYSSLPTMVKNIH